MGTRQHFPKVSLSPPPLLYYFTKVEAKHGRLFVQIPARPFFNWSCRKISRTKTLKQQLQDGWRDGWREGWRDGCVDLWAPGSRIASWTQTLLTEHPPSSVSFQLCLFWIWSSNYESNFGSFLPEITAKNKRWNENHTPSLSSLFYLPDTIIPLTLHVLTPCSTLWNLPGETVWNPPCSYVHFSFPTWSRNRNSLRFRERSCFG